MRISKRIGKPLYCDVFRKRWAFLRIRENLPLLKNENANVVRLLDSGTLASWDDRSLKFLAVEKCELQIADYLKDVSHFILGTSNESVFRKREPSVKTESAKWPWDCWRAYTTSISWEFSTVIWRPWTLVSSKTAMAVSKFSSTILAMLDYSPKTLET